MKISDKIAEYREQGKPFYSFEFFPPKTELGLKNLYDRIDRMVSLNPAFIDITWGAGGSTADLTMEISKTIQKYFGVDVMMHLTCTNMPETSITEVLDEAKDSGLSNILALRGDPPGGEENWTEQNDGFSYGKDLVSYIRSKHGNHFFLGVAGYPEGHQEHNDVAIGINHLKEKVDAGSDMIITQLFYNEDLFLKFRDKCVGAGITVPIVPGIMPIHNYSRFLKFTRFCNVNVPTSIYDQLEPIKNDDASVIEYGIDQATQMCEMLLKEGVSGLHFYTLNLESSILAVINNLGLSITKKPQRKLPWRQSTMDDRKASEDVRPIYWSNRPVSYLARTQNWDDFPNGRWGDISSPTFGELNQYHAIRAGAQSKKNKVRRKKVWGEPQNMKEIINTFVSFCEGKINLLPWCEMPLALESEQISDDLIVLNKNGYLTINSQPKVNGAPSDDAGVGWGGENGRVYQKAYLEFFTTKEKLSSLEKKIDLKSNFTFQAVNSKGDYRTNLDGQETMAVTWGVFPGTEIVQPTVIDSRSFQIWKDEAFELWLTDWASIYENDSISYKLIKEIHNSYYLVNIVDNDYVDGNIFKIFH
tara:strand:- start:3857 stop:5617 length:1761 start_codon:yes stop_codon:yes gene_type:complete